MPNKNKQLGTSNERQLTSKLKNLGVQAERVPLSGALKSQPGDVKADEMNTLFECKVRSVEEAHGLRFIRLDLGWLDKIRAEAKRAGQGFGAVAIRAKGSGQFYIVTTLEDYVHLHQQGRQVDNTTT